MNYVIFLMTDGSTENIPTDLSINFIAANLSKIRSYHRHIGRLPPVNIESYKV
jgi:hypothetical protein